MPRPSTLAICRNTNTCKNKPKDSIICFLLRWAVISAETHNFKVLKISDSEHLTLREHSRRESRKVEREWGGMLGNVTHGSCGYLYKTWIMQSQANSWGKWGKRSSGPPLAEDPLAADDCERGRVTSVERWLLVGCPDPSE